MKHTWIISMATVSAAAMFAPTAAIAQAPAPAQATPQADTPEADSAPANEAIIVTGTRLTTGGFESPTPVSVVNTDELIKRAPSTLADALNQLPVFQNSINGNQQQFTQANRQRTGNYLNLRSLGTQRVLVMQDSQRLPVTGTNGGVDVSLVPQLLTQRVDVVTGGASAAYGSDAVSGVVNFILDKHYNGLKAQGQFGVATRGGYAKSHRLGIAGGTSLLDDRLHVIASAERYKIDPVLRSDLPSIRDLWAFIGTGTAADPVRYVRNVGYADRNAAGITLSGPVGFKTKQFGTNGELIAFDPGLPSGNPGTQIGGDLGFLGQECCTITPGQVTNQVFGRAEYEFSDTVKAFVSVGYNWAEAHDFTSTFLRAPITIFRENAYLTPATLAALGPAASFTMGKTISNQHANDTYQKSTSLNIATGIDGKIGALNWNVGYVHGETMFDTQGTDFDNAHVFAAIDAVKDASGNTVCRVTVTNPGLYPGCLPLNLFGTATHNPAALAYVQGLSTYRAVNKMDSWQANLSGDLFQGWAGPVSFALGAEYRTESLLQTSNSDPTTRIDTTGLRGVPATVPLGFNSLNIGGAKGSYNIKEFFGELNVPVLKDSAVGSLELNGAVRHTNYSTSGGVNTWKAGGVYDPIDGVRFRATVSRDIRAPTLYELFSGQTSTGITFSDRLTGVNATSRQISGGNPNLKPEVANTLTAGIVLKPSFLPGLNFSADYFRIKIKEAIGTPFSAFQIVDLCYASGQTSPLCSAITRPLGPTNTDPLNTPSSVLTNLQNISTQSLSGIDFELSYSHPVGNGRVSARIQATRQITFNQTVAPGQPTLEFAGTADFNDVQFPLPLPKWRGAINLGYDSDTFGINIQERIVGGYLRSKQLVYAQNKVPAVAYTDLNLTYKLDTGFAGKVELFATANNLLDRDAPIVPVTRTPGLTVPTIRSTYDVLGRYVTVGARIKM